MPLLKVKAAVFPQLEFGIFISAIIFSQARVEDH